MATPGTFRAYAAIVLLLALVYPAQAVEQIDQSNLPEWAGGWTHVNPAGDGQAVMWQTFTPACTNLTAVEIDILTISPGRGDDVLIVEIAGDGVVLASAERAVEDGFDGLLRFDFPEAVPLIPEQLYELAVRDTGATRFGWKYGPNTYERGSRYVFAQQKLGSDWFFQTCAGAEPAATKYSGGMGEPNDPYRIATAADLIALGETPDDYDKHFLLTADIDLDPNLPGRKVFDRAVIAPASLIEVEPYIEGPPFTGVLDGNGHTISHLTIMGADVLGLFGQLGPGSCVSNLGLEFVAVSGGRIVGSLVGSNGSWRTSDSTVTRCHSSGLVGGTDYVGGLVGANYGGIAESHSTSSVSGAAGVGGLVGFSGGSVVASHSSGLVGGVDQVGGLVGSNGGGSVVASHSSGLVGGADQVGGLIGSNGAGSVVGSYSIGSVTGDVEVGGLVGSNRAGSIVASYSIGSVTGDMEVGGLVGSNRAGSIVACYSIGSVGAEWSVGGLVGFNGEGGSIRSSFWDIQTSGQTTSDGGTGLTTAEMQDIETFVAAGWDLADEVFNGTCDYWQMLQGEYPHLDHHAGSQPSMPEGRGTAEQPYLIRDARDLGTLFFAPLAYYRLVQPVDLSGIVWSTAPIPWFGGTFDGNGHPISNLCIRGVGPLGLFGTLGSTGSVSSVGLEAFEISGTGWDVGRLAGVNQGSITTSYSSGSVTGGYAVGGLVGANYGCIAASYSGISVSGAYDVGGLVGANYGRIAASYSTSSVGSESSVGGLAAYNFWGSIIACFWDIQTSGQVTSAGGIGKTTAEMQTVSTFLDAGWDFVGETANGTEDIWWILEGQDYPRLWWEATELATDD